MTGLVHDALLQQHRHQIQQTRAAQAQGGGIVDDMIPDFPLLQPDMIHGSRRATHPAGDLRALEGGSRGGGAGDPAVLVPQDHLAVGADVEEQGQLPEPVEPQGRHAAHGIAADEARDVGQDPGIAPFQGLKNGGHIGRGHQGPRVDAQQQMVHGGVAHHSGGGDVLHPDAPAAGRLPGQARDGGPDAFAQLLSPALQGALDPGDHIRAEAALGIDAAGPLQDRSRSAIQQIGHHGGGADVQGQGVGVRPVGLYRRFQTPGQDPHLLRGGSLHGHVPVHDGPAGQDLRAIHPHPAFSAGAIAAAGGVGPESGGRLGRQQRGPLLHRRGDPVGQEGHLIALHGAPSFYRRQGPMLPSAP